MVAALVWTFQLVELAGNVYEAGFKPVDVCFDACHEGDCCRGSADEGAKNAGGDYGDCVDAHGPLFSPMCCNVATRKKGKPWVM